MEKRISGRLGWMIATLMTVPLSFISAPYPTELLLQHVPTVLGVVLLAAVSFKVRITRFSFGCCLAFVWLHIIGARWIYSFVPYDDVARWISGHTLSETFGWQRNHYDRLVHFASGLLGMPPLAEWLQRSCELRPVHAACLAMTCVLAIGAAYEILEWQIALTFSPTMAESYNGQQGDVWDPQKDLALAWLGSAIALPLVAARRVDTW